MPFPYREAFWRCDLNYIFVECKCKVNDCLLRAHEELLEGRHLDSVRLLGAHEKLLEGRHSDSVRRFGHTHLIHDEGPKGGCADGDVPPSTRDSRDGKEKLNTLVPAICRPIGMLFSFRKPIREYFRDELGCAS